MRKLIYKNSWLSIYVPATFTGWMSVGCILFSVKEFISGRPAQAFDALQLSLLLTILDCVSSECKEKD